MKKENLTTSLSMLESRKVKRKTDLVHEEAGEWARVKFRNQSTRLADAWGLEYLR